MTESSAPEKKSKLELEQLVKSNGGKIYQTNTAASDTVCIADRSMFSHAESTFLSRKIKLNISFLV
jgi:DNA-binding beta-propeller fold protein YncE